MEGIEIIEQEDSYTSKASCIDVDVLPVFVDKHIPDIFSRKRIERRLSKSINVTLINADVNGSYNILRKAVPKYYEGIEVALIQPLKLSMSDLYEARKNVYDKKYGYRTEIQIKKTDFRKN